MLNAFGDDSTDEMKERVFAVAAVMALEDEWQRLEALWLDRTNGVPFHATDCDSDRGVYSDKSHKENKALYRDLVQILVNSEAYGFGAAIDLRAFREIYPEIPQEMCYYKAFFETIRRLGWFAKRRFNDSIRFTFDNRTESNYSAGLIYTVMVRDCTSAPDAPELFSKITFTTPIKQPRIQAGDLYAREVMKYLDHEIGPEHRKRRSMEVLKETKRFGCDLFSHEYFEDMRRQTSALERNDQEFNRETYVQWLNQYRLPDTMKNRFRFLEFVSARDAERKA